MWWLPLAMGLMSGINEKNKENQLKNYNLGQAEVTRYSPWTGMTGQIQRDTGPGVLGAGVSGAVAGLGTKQSLDNAADLKSLRDKLMKTPAIASSPYAQALGSYNFNTPSTTASPLLMNLTSSYGG